VPSNTNNLNNFFNFFNSGGSSGSNSGSSSGKTQEVGAGSGFIISANGYILTNKHVVAASQDSYTVIMNNGKQYNAHVVSLDPTNDLAVVKINATNLPYLTLGNSSSLQLGQGVIAIGNALGQYQNTVDTGVVSGLARTVQAQDPATGAVETLNDVIQTDAEINPGNSGGPLLNLQGQVIGINTAVASTAHGIGFAIPINQAKADIQSVLKNGKIIKPELGVQYEPVTPGLQKTNHLKYSYGALIVKSSSHPGVVSNTPASRAGLKTGDIILEVNGQKVTSTDPLNYLIGKQQINTTITLQIYNKSGSIQNVSVTLNKVFK
jgi:serine protease Do